ncbi:MAG: hypothetical protein M3Z09_14990, partial [Acidobacteriota bacterium]|nr:hypothetical protein [Acidobacteriota bacterium]
VFQTGLNLMRDLLRKGVRTVGVDNDLEHQGFRSVYGKSYACPNPDTHPDEWVGFMKDLSQQLGAKPVFIPAADIFIAALGRHAEALQDHYLVSPPAAALQASLATKEKQYALAAEFGFPCPRMAYVKSRAELRNFMSSARFPCLIKPRSPREWSELPADNPLSRHKVIIAETPEELLRYYAWAEPCRPEAVAQEVIQGLGSAKFVYLSVYGAGARLLGNCVVQEIRDYPPFTGMPSMVKPVADQEIATLCDNFLRRLNYRGICEFEVKRDVRDGQVRLIEMNPRFSGTGDVASYIGIETGWLHYLDMIGRPVVPVQPARFDFHHVSLRIESAESIHHLLRGDLKWRELLAPYRGKIEYFDFDLRDRRLAASVLGTSVRNVAGHLMRHIKRSWYS